MQKSLRVAGIAAVTSGAMVGASGAIVGALGAIGAGIALAQDQPPAPDPNYEPPQTPWGDPDLQGRWPGTAMVGVPMQRPAELGTRNWLTEEEYAERVARAERQEDIDLAEFSLETADETPGGAVGGPVSPPPHWLERGSPQRQASLIVEPPDGRMPATTEAARQRQAAERAARQDRGQADSYLDRSQYDRCITRGIAGSVLPVIYNNGNQIVQAPGYVAIVNEMIHEARVIPLDGRPHVSSDVRMWLGDSRGHWEGSTLVVETTNLTDQTGIGVNGGGMRHSESIKITEKLTRISDDQILYSMRIDDPETWEAPWTFQLPLDREDDYGMFEYACHEGNYAMFNILSGARAEERAAAEAGQ
jgi:hypothetical protein